MLALFQRRGHFVYPACGSSNTSVVDKWSCPRFFMSSPQGNNQLEKSEFMNETHALTDRQIARRKTAAIWLVGVGVLLSPLLRIFFQKLIEDRLIKDIWEAQYATHLMGINHIALSILAASTAAAGWYLAGKLLDRSKTNFTKHWITAYLLQAGCAVGLSYLVHQASVFFSEEPTGQMLVQQTIPWFVCQLSIPVYMIWAVDSARKNGTDPAARKAAAFVQAASALQIIANSLVQLVSIQVYWDWAYSHNISSPIQGAHLFVYYLSWILPFALFYGMVKLLRSSLFVSTSAQLEEAAGQPAPRTPFFNAPVCGAIAGSVFCIGMTLLLTFFWTDIYNAF